MLCFLWTFVQTRIANISVLQSLGLNVMATMGGRWVHTANINDPFPWPGLAILLLMAAGVLTTTTFIIERQSL